MVRISEKDSNWLKGHFTKESYKKVLRGNVISDYLQAEKILNGYDKIKRRSCGCHYQGMARAVDKSYKEWLEKEIT